MYKKIISLTVIVIFLFDIFTCNIVNANIINISTNLTDFIISNNLGIITSSRYFNSDDIIINIQDLHCHAQTQKQISKILEELQTKYSNITEVYLEGAYKNVDTTWLSKLNKSSFGNKVIDDLITTGRLSGVEYYSVINNKRDFIKPIEEQNLYKENISLLNEIISKKKEVEIIYEQLEKDIRKIKSLYSNKKSQKLYQVDLAFQNNKLTTIQYYNKLIALAHKNNIDVTQYINIISYIEISNKNKHINKNKLFLELNKFISVLKEKLSYEYYSDLLNRSNNFKNIDNITQTLIDLDNKYQITINYKLNNLKKFLDILILNKKINPMLMLQEEQNLKELLYSNFGTTKYEKYVLFLNDFVPSIKQYFSADISAQDYLNFEYKYKQFRTIWPLFFSDNKIKQLDVYNNLLSKYHKNNLKRDEVFSKKLSIGDNTNTNIEINDIDKSISNISRELNKKNVKVVVTGGFHTKGLETILNNNKISYIIITPKIFGDIGNTKQLYLDTIKYNETILKNTINLETLSQEQVNISFPKIMNSVLNLIHTDIFKNRSNDEIKSIIEEFVNKDIISVQPSNILKIKSFSMDSNIQNGKVKYNVVYEQDGTQKHRSKFITDIDYIYSNGQSIPYSKVDNNTVLKTIDAANKKYSVPSVMLEPDNNTRKKIEKYILKPLRDISSPYMEYMDKNQTHMTVAYDPSFNDVSEQEMDEILETANMDADIFQRTKNVGNKNLLQKAYMGGNLRLVSTGVIIYEITDKKLIEEMLNLRKELTSDNKYQTPNIVHMTIGRIMDKSLLEDTPQSREKLAELLKKVNEKIYEINQANELSKIKADFNLKGGYVSATGNKNYLVSKVKNNGQTLSIFKNFFKLTNKKIRLIYITILAPIYEELIFRILPSLPLLITTTPISLNPLLLIPVLVTTITGTILFSYSHTLADKIAKQEIIRNWKSFLPQSSILTIVYMTLLIAFPQQIFLAPVISIILHSLNNIIFFDNLELSVIDNSETQVDLTSHINNFVKKYLPKELADTVPSSQEQINVEHYQYLSDYFDGLEDVVRNNVFALQTLGSIEDGELFIGKMIDGIEVLDKEVARKARTALDNILVNIKNRTITKDQLNTLKSWNEKNIDKIKEFHTLINALHQTSYKKFSDSINDTKKKEEQLEGIYNCSENPKISYKMNRFLKNILTGTNIISHPCYFKDNFFIYSKQLGKHSVDMMIDLNESMRVSFTESSIRDGNYLRSLLLIALLRQIGFSLVSFKEHGAFSFVMEYQCSEIDLPEKYAQMFILVRHIFDNTNDLDYYIVDRDLDDDWFSSTELVKNLNISEQSFCSEQQLNVVHNYSPKTTEKHSSTMYDIIPQGIPKVFLEEYIPHTAIDEYIERYNKLQSYRQSIEQKQNIPQETANILQLKPNEKFPVNIVRAYVEGKLILNKSTNRLEVNKNYDGLNSLLDFISNGKGKTFRVAQLINLLDYKDFCFESEYHIGDFISRSGVLYLPKDNKWLSVKVIVDKERKRAKCAYVEIVDFEGNRQEIDYKKLNKLLKDNGYKVKEQKQRTPLEQEETKKILEEKIPEQLESIYLRGRGVSSLQNGYVPLRITYDKSKVDENSLWITSYITPEEVEIIKRCGGILTTSGGILSHANITARENNKIAILFDSYKWIAGKLELGYYYPTSSVENKGIYHVQSIEERKVELKEGDVVLCDGADGRILFFNNIPNIEELQNAINNDDIEKLKQIINDNKDKDNIGKIIEYIFFQIIGNNSKKDLLYALKNIEDVTIQNKINNLLERYINIEDEYIFNKYKNVEYIDNKQIKLKLLTDIIKELTNLGNIYEYYQKDIEEKSEIRINLLQKINEEVKKLIVQITSLLEKPTLSIEEINLLAKEAKKAKVWDYYNNSEIEKLIQGIDTVLKKANFTYGNYGEEIKSLDDIQESDLLKYGSKTTELACMTRLFKNDMDVNIPKGFGVSTNVLEVFLEKAGKIDEYLKLLDLFHNAILNKNVVAAKDIGTQIADLIDTADDKNDELKNYLLDLLKDSEDNKKYAIRSSGVGEDGGNHSFAGMAKTELNKTKQDVYDSIKTCWKSFFADECIEDMIGEEGVIVKPALLIQEMVENVKKAGVMFSRNSDCDMVIEVVRGLGEGLVSGKVNPDNITIKTSDSRIEYLRSIGNKLKISSKPNGGIETVELKETDVLDRILGEKIIKKLQKILRKLEKDAGYPVDVEFAIDSYDSSSDDYSSDNDSGNIYILQRRAITTFSSKEMFESTSTQLNILQGFFKKYTQKLQTIISTVIAPIFEEIIFRVLPSLPILITTAPISLNPALLVPVVLTSIIGTIIFSYSHTLADKISNQEIVRNWKSFLPQSIILTAIYLALLIAFPQQIFLAPIISIILHSLNNVLSYKNEYLNILNILNGKQQQEYNEYDYNKLYSEIDKSNLNTAKKQELQEQLKTIKENIDSRITSNIVEKQIATFLEEIKYESNASAILNEILNLYLNLYQNKFLNRYDYMYLPINQIEVIINKNIDNKESLDYIVSSIYNIFDIFNNYISNVDFVWEIYAPKIVDLISKLYEQHTNSIDNDMFNWVNSMVSVYQKDSEVGEQILIKLYKRIGVSKETLLYFISSLSGKTRKIQFPNIYDYIKINNIDDIENIANMFIENREFLSLSNICVELFNSNDSCRLVCKQICDWLLETLEFQYDDNLYNTFYNIINSKIFNELDESRINFIIDKYNNGTKYKSIKNFYYVPSEYNGKSYTVKPYVITSLITKTEFKNKSYLMPMAPIEYRRTNVIDVQQTKKLRVIFKTFRELLENNVISLDLLNDAKDIDDLKEVIDVIQIMVNKFSVINSESAKNAQIALNNIKASLVNNKINIYEYKKIEQWTESKIANITTLNTLINAIHQTAISTFRKNLSSNVEENKNSLILSHVNNNKNKTSIGVYDISEKTMHKDILKFLELLSLEVLPKSPYDLVDSKQQIKDLICMDDLLVWTPRLGEHSIDIIMNFNELNREITISFNESASNSGNEYRILYFKTVLNKLGFKTSGGKYNLKATLDSNNGLNENIDIVSVMKRVMVLFKYSSMLDFDFYEYRNYSNIEYYVDQLVDKFFSDDIWFGYSPNSVQAWGNSLFSVPNKPKINITELQGIFDRLGLEEIIPDKIVSQTDVDKYINIPLERAYAVGRIILDKDGNLIKNENYNIIQYLAQNVLSNKTEATYKAILINLLPKSEFKFRPVGYIGNLLAVSGYLKLKDNSYLAVKGLVDPKNNAMYYCIVEHVTENGREKIDGLSIVNILRSEGYNIQNQKGLSQSEQRNIDERLSSATQFMDTPDACGQGTSESNGLYVCGFITTDKNNVDENSIYVTQYTTPDDIDVIQKVKGVITTSGGTLSHAAITTREYKKPSMILSNALWNKQGVEISYYTPENKISVLKKLQVRSANKEQILLKEGTRVLLNGDTGHLLLYIGVDNTLLSQLQDAIDNDDAQIIKQIFIANENNKDINKIIEYVYFQVIGNTKTPNSIDMLFDVDMPVSIKEKIKDLNKGYIQNKIKVIDEAIRNLNSISDPNKRYRLFEKIKEKLNVIKTVDDIEAFNKQKNAIAAMEKEIKDELYKFIKSIIDESYGYINNVSSNIDISRIMTIIQQASFYDMFVLENEQRQDLQEIKQEISNVITQLRNVVKNNTFELNTKRKKVATLVDIEDNDVSLFGSKTVELAKINKIINVISNVSVPKGVGISVLQFEDFINIVGDKNKINDFEEAIKNNDFQTAQKLAQDIISMIDNGKTNIEANKSMKKVVDYISNNLKNTKYFVRTSGVGEDSAKYAFAGMGKTIPNVDVALLYNAIIECWKSFYSDRSIEYMIQSGQVVKPAILVQEAIDVEKAGVIFTNDNYGNATIESLYGQGEGLVSGKLTPDTITVDLNSGDVLEYYVATKQYQYNLTKDGMQRKVSKYQPKSRVLNYREISKLTKVAMLLETNSGYPLDIEFGIKKNNIYILQRRPITTNDINNNGVSKQSKLNIHLEFDEINENLDEFVNIQNPLNKEEAITVYLKIVKENDKYLYKFVVDQKYKSIEQEIIEKLKERIKDDPVIMKKLNNSLSLYSQVKENEFEILPVIDKLDITEIKQSSDINIIDVRNMLASA